jgi:lipopolysaccharide export system protein LptA
MKKKNIIFFLIIFLLISSLIIFLKYSKEESVTKIEEEVLEEPYKSNIMEDVSYSSKDAKGNEYIVNASKGEIDYDRPNIIYLTNVRAFIKLTNSNDVTITSDFGKYNTNNFDTIFSKNVEINYLDNKITGEYLDFSIGRNSMIISRKVVYTNLENILKADVIEINVTTKDTKIFMYKDNKKVNIKSKD